MSFICVQAHVAVKRNNKRNSLVALNGKSRERANKLRMQSGGYWRHSPPQSLHIDHQFVGCTRAHCNMLCLDACKYQWIAGDSMSEYRRRRTGGGGVINGRQGGSVQLDHSCDKRALFDNRLPLEPFFHPSSNPFHPLSSPPLPPPPHLSSLATQ